MSHKEDFFKQCLIIDFETTGLDYKTAEIIEAGFCIRENDEWVIFQELHKPIDSVVPPMVSSITYITNKMVADCPTFHDSKAVFQSVVDGYVNGYAVGHNYFYDMQVGQRHGITFPRESLCTWRMCRKLLTEFESTSLPYLRYAMELDVPEDMHAHRAGNDCYMTGKLLEVLVDIIEEAAIIDISEPYGPQIDAWLVKPIITDTMTFGKHKGERFVDIPAHYWKWAFTNLDTLNEDSPSYDADFAASLCIALDID